MIYAVREPHSIWSDLFRLNNRSFTLADMSSSCDDISHFIIGCHLAPGRDMRQGSAWNQHGGLSKTYEILQQEMWPDHFRNIINRQIHSFRRQPIEEIEEGL